MRSSMSLSSILIAMLAAGPAYTQLRVRQASQLHGTVQSVNQAQKTISVANEPIPGGMGAMTMNYAVDRVELLGTLKPGDRITAKMYEGDSTLYEVQVESARAPTETPTHDAPRMRLEDLETMALANNPTIVQAKANVQMSAGFARQAGLYPNPTVGYYGDEIRGGYTGGGKQGGFISQTIVMAGKLKAARQVAKLLTQQAETSGEEQRLRILNNVRAAFYDVLADQSLVDVKERLTKLAADAVQTAHQLANVGQADRPDLLQAEVEQQQMEVSLRVAQRNLQAAWRMLVAVAGNPALAQARVDGDLENLPDLNYDDWLARTLRDSPEIKLAQQQIERSEASLIQAKKVAIPDLQLSANLTQNNELLETTHRPIGLNGGVQIGVQLPLFNRNQGNVAAAKYEVEGAKQELSRLKLQLARDTATVFRDYDSARVTARQYKTEMLPRAEQAYRLYQTNYQQMSAAYPQALISQRTLFQLEGDYVEALRTAWQSALSIRGFGLMNGLSPTMASRTTSH